METSLTFLTRLSTQSDEEDWKRLHDLYGPLFDLWISRSGVNVSDRDDIKQEILLVVARRVRDFQHQHAGAFRGWLRMILQNVLKRYFNTRMELICSLSMDELCLEDSQLARKHDREHDEYVARRAMQVVRHDFSPDTWLAFQMQVLEGQDANEVAQQLQTSVNAVLKSKARVLKRIRQELSPLLEV
jgi:RNA polymerase sigma-70 factor (ECF subfamily)